MAKKKGTNSVTMVLLMLLVLGLGGFGITNFGGSIRAVATVGGAEIGVTEYARAVEAQMRSFEERTGQRLSFQQARLLGADRAALMQLIAQAAFEDEVAELGISAGDANVSRDIQESGAFRNVAGEFDRQTYELALKQANLGVDEFEAKVRSDIAEGLLRRAVSTGFGPSSVHTDTLFNYIRETRDVTWARLTAADLETPVAAPDETQVAAYHTDNPEAFTRPETKVIRYAWLTPEMLVGKITVEDAQLRTLYESRIDEFVRPERRLVERLVFADEAEAQAAKARIDSGEASFDDLVAERGLALDDVDLGDVPAGDLGAAGDAVFAMTEPGVAGPLASELGPALFRMNGILAAEETTFEEARTDLAEEAAADRARRMILDSVPQIEDLLAGGADMAGLAERTDLEEGRIEWNEEVFEGIAAYAAFRSAAAAAQQGDFPKITDLDDGGIVVLGVDEVLPAALRPLDEVREAVVAAWTRDAEQAALTARAEDLAAAIRGGREMAALGLDLETRRKLDRVGFVEGTPPDFTRTVFEMAPDELRVLAADGDAWVVRLDAVTPPDPTTEEAVAARAAFTLQSEREMAGSVTAAFTQALVDEAGVEVDQAALNAVHAQLP